MSRANQPKQFLDFLGTGKSLIRQTFERFQPLCKNEHFFVVTNAKYKELVLEHLPELEEDQVLCEPDMRNTAPCLAYANWRIQSETNEASIIVTPADQLILKEELFRHKLTEAISFSNNHEALVTLGIEPHRPDTGYGYIEASGAPINGHHKVAQFREKPDLETAKTYVQAANFYWNSGMFIWTLSGIQRAFQTHLPHIHDLFLDQKDAFGTSEEQLAVDSIYEHCESISIDYGVMEKATNVFVAPADIGWSDLGTWGSIYEHLDHDQNGNAVSNKTYLKNATNNLIQSNQNRAIVVDGLKDFIVIDTKNVLLISPKANEQDIKQIRAEVAAQFGEEHA